MLESVEVAGGQHKRVSQPVLRLTAKASGTALSVLALLLLSGGAASATATFSLDAAAPDSASHEPLASPVLGCWDPQSWVWSGPRAERVTIAISVDGPCEIGSDDCDREPESVAPEPVIVTAYEVAALTCALKQAQHEQQAGAEPFDAKSCFEAEMTLWSSDDVDPAHQPFEGLSCSEKDPECRSAPPLPQTAQLHAGPTATAPVVATVPGALRARPLRPAALGAPLRGVYARVERPPSL